MPARTFTQPNTTGNYITAASCSDGHTTYKDYTKGPGDLWKCGKIDPATKQKCGKDAI